MCPLQSANQAANASGQGPHIPNGPGGGQRSMMVQQSMMMGVPGAPMAYMNPQAGVPYPGFPMMGMSGQNHMHLSNGMGVPMMYPWVPSVMANGGNGNPNSMGGMAPNGGNGAPSGAVGRGGANDPRDVRSYVDLDAPAEGEPDYGF